MLEGRQEGEVCGAYPLPVLHPKALQQSSTQSFLMAPCKILDRREPRS